MVLDPLDPSSWTEYRRLVLAELERLNRNVETLSGRIEQIRDREIRALAVDVAMLKVKCAALGALSGIAAAVVTAAVAALRGHP